MVWPREYGGHERSALERYIVIEELLASGAPVAAHWFSDRQVGPLLLRYGGDAQRRLFLGPMARGECYFSIGMSEPDAGSDLAAIRTTARPTEGGWRVNGTKLWTSHAHHNHYMLTLVRTSSGTRESHAGMSQLIIDLKSPGVAVRPIRLLNGEQHFNEVVFEDVLVAPEMLVGAEGDGWEQAVSELTLERSGPERFLSTFPVLLQLVVEGGEPGAIGRLCAQLAALRRLSLSVATCIEAGQFPDVEAALVKDLGTRFERDLTEVARVSAPKLPSERFRHLLAEAILSGPGFTLRGGTNEILRGIVARGLAAG
jgi:hypothetical protein